MDQNLGLVQSFVHGGNIHGHIYGVVGHIGHLHGQILGLQVQSKKIN
jgi:hypothetical protein